MAGAKIETSLPLVPLQNDVPHGQSKQNLKSLCWLFPFKYLYVYHHILKQLRIFIDPNKYTSARKIFEDYPHTSSLTKGRSKRCRWNPPLGPSGHICNSPAKQEIYLFSYVLYVFPLTKKIGLCDGHLIQTKMHFKLQTGNLRNLDNNSCWLHCQSEEKVQFMSVTYDWQLLWWLKISLLHYVTKPFKETSMLESPHLISWA